MNLPASIETVIESFNEINATKIDSQSSKTLRPFQKKALNGYSH